MGQTIICEYLAKWEETSTAPDPTDFGFGGLYEMLVECQDAMLKLGTAANTWRATAEAQQREFYNHITKRNDRIAELEALYKTAALAAIEMQDKIAKLEAEIAAKDGYCNDLEAQIGDLLERYVDN